MICQRGNFDVIGVGDLLLIAYQFGKPAADDGVDYFFAALRTNPGRHIFDDN